MKGVVFGVASRAEMMPLALFSRPSLQEEADQLGVGGADFHCASLL